MGKRQGQNESPVIPIGETATRFVSGDTAFWAVHNLQPTDEGGYISVSGPLPVFLFEGGGAFSYGLTYGIFHARVMNGERDILLVHSNDTILELSGWRRNWRAVVGPAGSAPMYTDIIPDPAPTDYRTQFVATPTGVVIIPSFGRAYFYDGVKCLPLGYSQVPGPPVGRGPENTSGSFFPDDAQPLLGVNDSGYVIDGLQIETSKLYVEPYFRYGRLGTVTTPGNMPSVTEDDDSNTMGYLEPGRWRARTQWIDCWGNLSPLSPASNDVRVSRQPSEAFTNQAPPYTLGFVHADRVRKQFGWQGISQGPTGTIGRMVLRTKDMINSGDTDYYEVPRDAAVNAQAFATLPDNVSTFYPDNIPDAWLVNKAVEVAQVPLFRVAAMSFGRLFIANFRGDPGAIMWSMVGRWGTFETTSKLYPDPTAAAVTGLHRVDGGLLAFTENGTFLITPNAEGDGFRSATVSESIGCIAPTSICTMNNGVVVWLGRDGFYGYAQGTPTWLFGNLTYHSKRFNRVSFHKSVAVFAPKTGEYRCWVPYESSIKANMCFVYDGTSWHTRDEVTATGACVTQDHRNLILVSGTFEGTSGAWVVDQGGDTQPAYFITAWFRATRSKERSSVRWVWLWLRETGNYTGTSQISVEVYRDYRAEVVSTSYAQAYAVEGGAEGPAEPSFWDADVFGTTAIWRHRRPYWVRVDIDVPRCEVFRLKVSCTDEVEFMGLSFDETPQDTSGTTAYGV